MATPNLDFQNFYSSTLSSTITAADTTIYLDTLPTPSEGYLVIEPDSSTNREVVWYTSKGANYVTVPSSGGRGVGGTSAAAHSSGATVNMNNVAEMWTAIKDGSANTGMHQWFNESFSDYVYSGATIAPASGLIASISSGVVYINGRRLTLNAASKTFTASKDTYVDVVALSGSNTATLSYTEVNSGVSGSAPVSNGMHIAKVNTTASAIATSVQAFTDTLGNPIKQTSPVSAVGIHNPYKFSAYRSAAWTTNNSPQLVQFDTETFDSNSNFDITTNKGRYTVPVSGFYWVSACTGNSTSTSAAVGTYIYKNGAVEIQGNAIVNTVVGVLCNVSGLIQLSAGDYIEAYNVGGGGSAGFTGKSICYFHGFLVSQT